MKLDLNQTILDTFDREVPWGKYGPAMRKPNLCEQCEATLPDPESHSLTMRDVIIFALGTPHKNDEPSAKEKLERGRISIKCASKLEAITLTSDEAVMIQKCINLHFNAIIYTRVYDIMEGEKEEKETSNV